MQITDPVADMLYSPLRHATVLTTLLNAMVLSAAERASE